jgi:3',5'-cyclic AMP phosphodiesterase CpdA
MSRLPLAALVCCLPLACGDDAAPADGTDASTGGAVDGTTGEPAGTEGIDGSSSGADESTGGDTTTGPLPDPLPPLDAVPLTTDETIVPSHAIDDPPVLDPRDVAERQQMLDEGYGDFDLGPGEPVLERTPDGMPAPAPGPGAAMLSRFVHLADSQLADDESPLRVVVLDNPVVDGGYRAQESHACHVLNAAVRSLNAIDSVMPLDFVVLGGDNADAAQRNEVQWFLGIMDGVAAVHCDSGDDDDPVPGPDNDPKDPFAPVGLAVPWIWVSGNHDTLVQGNFETAGREEQAIGSAVGSSTRDWSMPGGPVFNGPAVADEGRALLDGPALMELVASSGDGHGITAEVAATGRATFAWDAPGSDLRIIVVDTSNHIGGSDGVIRQSQIDDTIRPLFDQAEADGKWVIVSTHHASQTLTDDGGLPGAMPFADALQPADWQAFLGDYPNVLAHLCGHSHRHQVEWIEPIGGTGYWEVITSALIDWPHQMRMFELHDQDNGWLTLRAISVNYATEDDALGAEGRALAIADYVGGWVGDGAGTLDDHNVELWIEAP